VQQLTKALEIQKRVVRFREQEQRMLNLISNNGNIRLHDDKEKFKKAYDLC